METKKRVLFIAEIFPFPAVTGGKLRTSNLLKQISKYCDVDFVCFSVNQIPDKDVEQAKLYCKSVHVFNKASKSLKIKQLINVFKKECNAVFRIYSDEMQSCVDGLYDRNNYAAIWVERLYAFSYISKSKVIKKGVTPIYVDMHDVEHEAVNYFKKIEKNPFRKMVFSIEYRKVIAFEKEVFHFANNLFVVSGRDKAIYTDKYNLGEKIDVINNAIDTHKVRWDNLPGKKDQQVLFVGSLKHLPNLHGISWFVERAWPEIQKRNKDSKLVIAGSGDVTEEFRQQLANGKNVEFRGFVEDISDLMHESACMIVPLFSGSGTRLKIIEAFSYKLPVVSTTIGAEGLDVSDRENLLIADTEIEMNDAISLIFEDPEFVEQMIENSYKLVATKYEWDGIGEYLNKKYFS